MEELNRHVWKTDETELKELIETGYDVIYQDVSLSVIYEELANCFTDEQIAEHFGYYGLCELVQVDGMYYWLMLV